MNGGSKISATKADVIPLEEEIDHLLCQLVLGNSLTEPEVRHSPKPLDLGQTMQLWRSPASSRLRLSNSLAALCYPNCISWHPETLQ